MGSSMEMPFLSLLSKPQNPATSQQLGCTQSKAISGIRVIYREIQCNAVKLASIFGLLRFFTKLALVYDRPCSEGWLLPTSKVGVGMSHFMFS